MDTQPHSMQGAGDLQSHLTWTAELNLTKTHRLDFCCLNHHETWSKLGLCPRGEDKAEFQNGEGNTSTHGWQIQNHRAFQRLAAIQDLTPNFKKRKFSLMRLNDSTRIPGSDNVRVWMWTPHSICCPRPLSVTSGSYTLLPRWLC